jgi:hypothetical protein
VTFGAVGHLYGFVENLVDRCMCPLSCEEGRLAASVTESNLFTYGWHVGLESDFDHVLVDDCRKKTKFRANFFLATLCLITYESPSLQVVRAFRFSLFE